MRAIEQGITESKAYRGSVKARIVKTARFRLARKESVGYDGFFIDNHNIFTACDIWVAGKCGKRRKRQCR